MYKKLNKANSTVFEEVTMSIEYKKANNNVYGHDNMDNLCEIWDTS